jgi:hypothetical protein
MLLESEELGTILWEYSNYRLLTQGFDISYSNFCNSTVAFDMLKLCESYLTTILMQ